MHTFGIRAQIPFAKQPFALVLYLKGVEFQAAFLLDHVYKQPYIGALHRTLNTRWRIKPKQNVLILRAHCNAYDTPLCCCNVREGLCVRVCSMFIYIYYILFVSFAARFSASADTFTHSHSDFGLAHCVNMRQLFEELRIIIYYDRMSPKQFSIFIHFLLIFGWYLRTITNLLEWTDSFDMHKIARINRKSLTNSAQRIFVNRQITVKLYPFLLICIGKLVWMHHFLH